MDLRTTLSGLMNRFFRQKDLLPPELDPLDWRPDAVPGSLATVRKFAAKKARAAIGWYFAGKKWKALMACYFRVSMILLTAAASIVPLANEIHQNYQAREQIQKALEFKRPATGTRPAVSEESPALFVPVRLFDPVWSAVLIAIAAMLLALDRFHGSTTGWVRYVLTAQKLTEALDDFEMTFETLRLEWIDGNPTLDQTRATLALAQSFMKQISKICGEETGVWAAEFGAATQQLDQQLTAANEAAALGTLRVKVVNGDKCAGPWSLAIGNRPPEEHQGTDVSLKLRAGTYPVLVTGKIGTNDVRAENTAIVHGGGVVDLSLTLA